ncbi:MAG: FadR family transcriptional regulator [Lachnospiraceae bacterium]|nr:FadR family transcriptional regulator [Lachnospiraceae bacterium]
MEKTKDNDTLQVLAEIGSNLPYSRRSPISGIICERLKDAILSGDIPAGYCFPNEIEICDILDIGRSSLREAYSRLQLLGLITRTKNGTFVNDHTAMFSQADFNAIINESDMNDILDFRRVVEVAIAERAAERATDSDLKELDKLISEQDEAKDDPGALTEIDYRFHTALAELCGNQLLLLSLNTVRPKFKKESLYVFSKHSKYTIDEHRSIVRALKDRDSKAARAAMEAHLDSIADVIRKAKDD